LKGDEKMITNKWVRVYIVLSVTLIAAIFLFVILHELDKNPTIKPYLSVAGAFGWTGTWAILLNMAKYRGKDWLQFEYKEKEENQPAV